MYSSLPGMTSTPVAEKMILSILIAKSFITYYCVSSKVAFLPKAQLILSLQETSSFRLSSSSYPIKYRENFIEGKSILVKSFIPRTPE
nr:unnamed protein product [Callosobruchus chinensis]